MDKLDANAWKVLADLLELAGDEFSNHGCNDYSLPNTPENLEFMNAMLHWNAPDGTPDEYLIQLSPDRTEIYTSDSFLIAYFEHLAKELAGIE
jgi:hypothetical protein